MKIIHNLLNEQFAQSAARLLKSICYMLMLLLVLVMIMSAIGRQTFILHTNSGTYDNAIYAEKNHDWTSRGFTVYVGDEIRVITDQKIDFITHIGISAITFVTIAPLFICLWLLGRVFASVSEGQIFTEQNANNLLYYGLVGMLNAILTPFAKLLISNVANMFTNSKISISTGQNMLVNIISNIAFLVAAYIIHYGVRLQDESDHTI